MKRNNIYKQIALSLLCLVGSMGVAWGQKQGDTQTIQSYPVSLWPGNSGSGKSIVNSTNATALGGDREIIYAAAGESKRLSIQDGGSADNLDGYIRWYVVNSEEDITNTNAQTVENLQYPNITNNSNMAYGKILKFSNGIAWLRGTHTETYQRYNGQQWETTGTATEVDDISPGEICSIFYNVPSDFSDNSEIIVVCEASSLNNVQGQADDSQWTAPMVTFRHVFVIRPASERYNALNSRRSSLQNTYNGWENGGQTFLNLVAANKSNLFLESYEIHTPLTQGNDSNGNALTGDEIGTNYRIAEDMTTVSNNTVYSGNYWVSATQAANRVVWRVFNSSGVLQQLESDNGGTSGSYVVAHSNIWAKAFGETQGIDLNSTQTQVLYLVATVKRDDKGPEYPVGFFTVYLDPYTEPLTQEELNSKVTSDASHYSIRSTTYLEANNYKQIASLQFEADDTAVPNLDVSNNFAESPDVMRDADSYYAYAYPSEFSYRKNNRLSVGRGEYGLYRSLNYTDISKGDVTINEQSGVYNDYFATSSGVYNKYIYDRTYDQTDQYGFFLYLDATDDPGVISTIDLPNDLCSDTRLIVTAWVCDMAHTRTATHADVGLTFIGISEDDTETILSRFYSGKIMNKPSVWGAKSTYEQADWQQVYFDFTFQDLGYESYRLEISNNSPDSNGADYAIDDIQVWRSTPNIQVNRREACDASSLLISTDYNTLLNNMDWTEGEDISAIQAVAGDPDLLKYRLGLRGDADNTSNYPQAEMKVGNAYFSFLEGLTDDGSGNLVATGKTDVTESNPDGILGKDQYRWIRINKNLPEETAPEQSIYSLRVVVATDARTQTNYPKNEDAALKAERILNLRAVKDYNYLIDDTNWNNLWSGTNPVPSKPAWLAGQQSIELQGLTENNVNDAANESTYLSVIQTLYSRLQIPRIHCPWLDEEDNNILHLCPVDVDDTDLKYDGEIIGRNDDNTPITASGEYQVILFGAIEVNGWNDDNSSGPNLNDPCNLVSEFTVTRSVRIRVNTDPNTEGLICAGTQRQITAELLNKDTGEPLEEGSFGFDWFLGTQAEYDALTTAGTFGSSNGSNYTLKDAINEFRQATTNTSSFDQDDVEEWETSNTTMKEGLLSLFNDKNGRVWLLTDKSESFTLILTSSSIVAMPFIKTQVDGTLYCTEITEVPFDDYSTEVPEIHPGIPNVNYPKELTNIPVRVGLRHIANNKSLTIPLQKEISFAVAETENHYLIANPDNKNVTLYVDNMPTVATLDKLTVSQGSTSNELTLTFNDTYTFAEGQEYTLLIPFVESADGTTSIGSTCDGLAQLRIKVVPEYLTWQGDADDNWYDDDNWNQSTEKELHKGDDDTDANGTDNIENAYAPLYFTKVLIPEDAQLELKNLNTEDEEGTLDLTDNTIRYDMALDVAAAGGVEVKPYYINKVDQIHFEPSAEMLHAELLDYNKAWVDYKLESGKWHTLASPLQGVVAGDFYTDSEAGTGTNNNVAGTENQEYFTDIYFDEDDYKEDPKPNGHNNDNSRIKPSVYQRGWKDANATMKGIGEGQNDERAVAGNWSAVYNNVEEKYEPGTGFSLKVLDMPTSNTEGTAIFRLPKADTQYTYYSVNGGTASTSSTTSGTISRDNSGKLKISPSNETTTDSESLFTVSLEANGDYYLIGNPFMAYLDAKAFFEENSSLGSSYWYAENGVQNIVSVGNEDLISTDNATTNIPPLHSFFVRKAESATGDVTVTFKDNMQVLGTTTEDGTNTNALILTAQTADGKTSRAAIAYDATAKATYETSEDAELFLDSNLSDVPTIYTVAGTMATSINRTSELYNIPVGIYGNSTEMVTLSFEGLNHFSSATLYDAEEKTETPLREGTTLTVPASTSGRYFLRAGTPTANEVIETSDIQIYTLSGNRVMVTSNVPLKDIRVYTMNGAQVKHTKAGVCSFELYLADGIYLITAHNTSGETQAEKVVVR